MKKWLKRMGAAALSGVMLLALAACGGNTSTATQDDSSSGEKTKLYVVNWKDYASDDEELMAQFEEEYHCEIVNTYMESEEQLLTSLKTASPGTIDVCLPNCSILPFPGAERVLRGGREDVRCSVRMGLYGHCL